MNSPESTTQTAGSTSFPRSPPRPWSWRDHGTSHQVLDHLRQHFHHRDVADPSQGHGGGGQDEVSSQDGLKDGKLSRGSFSGGQEVFTHLLFTPNFVDGRLSPAPVGPVDDVIVHQAGGVDHL